MDPITLEEIREKALDLGWNDAAVTWAHISESYIRAYEDWIAQGFHGSLHYMENAKRCDPEEIFPGAKYAILFVSYYKQPYQPFTEEGGVVASYARGRDYHHVHRKRLKKFIYWLEERSHKKEIAKGFSDSTPVMEKALAAQAGLGWLGKNTLLIHRRFGTFTLLSGIFTTLEIQGAVFQAPLPKCGSCTKCIDSCPTQALVSPYILDATRCLSYHLIEQKGEVPEEISQVNPGYAFGCDICQDVCPHNARKPLSTEPEFLPEKGMGSLLDPLKLDALEKSPTLLFGTPLQRRGVQGLKNNLKSCLKEGC